LPNWEEESVACAFIESCCKQASFKFTGKIHKLTFKLEPPVKAIAESRSELRPKEAPEPDPIEEAK